MKLSITGILMAILMAVSSAFQVSYAQPKAVDLGLSVKWADRNLGASTPEGRGDYYAWGETKPKDDYSWRTYRWCRGSNDNITKYKGHSGDEKKQLDLVDDAACVQIGGKWRMPTRSEFPNFGRNVFGLGLHKME